MKYILEKRFRPVGYADLPYAYYDSKTNRTRVLTRDLFSVLLDCDGRKKVEEDTLTPAQHSFLSHLIDEGALRRAEDGEERELFREYRMFPAPYRELVQWSVTGGCNYRCRHCFMSAPDCVFGHLPLEKCLEICREIGSCGIRNVSITGGEPLIRGDLMQIIDCLLENEVMPREILTNGSLLSDEFLDGLLSRGVRPHFQLSYDGAGLHDWLRGVEGAEKNLVAAFERLRKRDLPFTCAMALHKKNISTIRETVLKVYTYGGTGLRITVAAPDGEWKKHTEYALSAEESYEAYLSYLPQFIGDGMPIDLTLGRAFTYVKGAGAYASADQGEEGFRSSLPVCAAFPKSIYISPEGDCFPCQLMMGHDEGRFPNLFREPLSKILSDSGYSRCALCTVGELSEHNGECAGCSYFKRCRGGCRARGYQGGGSGYYEKDPGTCVYFRNGWAERFRPFIDTINSIEKEKKHERRIEKEHRER